LVVVVVVVVVDISPVNWRGYSPRMLPSQGFHRLP